MAKSRTTALALPNISRTQLGKVVSRNQRTLKTVAGAGLIAFGGINLMRLTSKTVRNGIAMSGSNTFLSFVGNLSALIIGIVLIATDGK